MHYVWYFIYMIIINPRQAKMLPEPPFCLVRQFPVLFCVQSLVK
jgi:hypothetical protein